MLEVTQDNWEISEPYPFFYYMPDCILQFIVLILWQEHHCGVIILGFSFQRDHRATKRNN